MATQTDPHPDLTALATKDFKDIFGRDPTQAELAQTVPAYVGMDPSVGRGFVAQMYNTQENTPDKLYAKQQAKYQADAPKFADQVNGLFQGHLGRAATPEELTHFGSLLASGTTDAYQLQNFLQQQPEYQTKQNEAFQGKLSGQLSGYDQQYFQNSILPSIQEAYAKQGRSFDSSAFQGAATNAAQTQNVQRQQYLAGLSAQQYGGVQQNAYNDYANQVANQQNLTNSGIQAQYAGIQNTQNRSNEISDFNTQQGLYNQYLARYGKRGNALQGGLTGAIGGAAVGAKFGPWGALAGGLAGGGLGAWGSSQGGSY